jgi:hypothetical protein
MASLGWGVITVDLNGVVTFINRGIELSGLKQEKKCVGDLLKMYLKYAMEKRKASVETVDEEQYGKNEVLLLDNNCVKRMTIAEYLWISGAPIHNQRMK